MNHFVICHSPNLPNVGISLSAEIRRKGGECEVLIGKNLEKLFRKARKQDPWTIFVVKSESEGRLWRKRGYEHVDCNVEDFLSFARWTIDESDTEPDPPEYVIQRDSKEATLLFKLNDTPVD